MTRQRSVLLLLLLLAVSVAAGSKRPHGQMRQSQVVTTFVNWLTAQMPDSASDVFSNTANSFGAFLNAVIAFVIMAAVVYFFVVVPYTKAKERYFPSEASGPSDVELLTQIRDLLADRRTA